MKRVFTLCIALCALIPAIGQTDSTKQTLPDDTIHVGGMIIVRKAGKNQKTMSDKEYKIYTRRGSSPQNLSTNWWIFDIGFSYYNDNTNYASADAQSYAPGSNKTWFETKDGKSRNVNIWFFMQRLNIIKHVVNLKYGLGLELNNYHYEHPIRYQNPTTATPNPIRVIYDMTPERSYKKDKLAVDYLTVPMMLNFNFTPQRKNGFGFSAGISAGYRYSSRNKYITSDEGKQKLKDDFDLEHWKLSYVGELQLGPVRFYGSYAFETMYERGLDMTPYTFGFRFSNW